jgi:hypothetical protein
MASAAAGDLTGVHLCMSARRLTLRSIGADRDQGRRACYDQACQWQQPQFG